MGVPTKVEAVFFMVPVLAQRAHRLELPYMKYISRSPMLSDDSKYIVTDRQCADEMLDKWIGHEEVTEGRDGSREVNHNHDSNDREYM